MLHRMDDDDRPRIRQDAAAMLAKEALDTYSRDELDQRVELLQAEIERVRALRLKADSSRAAAEALFGGRPT